MVSKLFDGEGRAASAKLQLALRRVCEVIAARRGHVQVGRRVRNTKSGIFPAKQKSTSRIRALGEGFSMAMVFVFARVAREARRVVGTASVKWGGL